MPKRKGTVLAATAIAAALMATGYSVARDEDSPLHKIMEKVQVKNAAILKGVRNQVNFKKSQKDIVAAAKDLNKYAKEAKELPPDEAKPAEMKAKWNALMDDFIKEAGDFGDAAEKDDAQQLAIKNQYKKVQKTCTDCHKVFRPDDDDF